MTRDAVANILKDVRYRSWKFSMDQNGDTRIRALVTCAYTKRKRKRLIVYGYVRATQYPYWVRWQYLHAVREAISGILHHEMSEFFTYKGRRVFDAGH